jgi:hypothetical protein
VTAARTLTNVVVPLAPESSNASAKKRTTEDHFENGSSESDIIGNARDVEDHMPSGKKKAVDEDEEATATENESPVAEKTIKKRKTQHK